MIVLAQIMPSYKTQKERSIFLGYFSEIDGDGEGEREREREGERDADLLRELDFVEDNEYVREADLDTDAVFEPANIVILNSNEMSDTTKETFIFMCRA